VMININIKNSLKISQETTSPPQSPIVSRQPALKRVPSGHIEEPALRTRTSTGGKTLPMSTSPTNISPPSSLNNSGNNSFTSISMSTSPMKTSNEDVESKNAHRHLKSDTRSSSMNFSNAPVNLQESLNTMIQAAKEVLSLAKNESSFDEKLFLNNLQKVKISSLAFAGLFPSIFESAKSFAEQGEKSVLPFMNKRKNQAKTEESNQQYEDVVEEFEEKLIKFLTHIKEYALSVQRSNNSSPVTVVTPAPVTETKTLRPTNMTPQEIVGQKTLEIAQLLKEPTLDAIDFSNLIKEIYKAVATIMETKSDKSTLQTASKELLVKALELKNESNSVHKRKEFITILSNLCQMIK